MTDIKRQNDSIRQIIAFSFGLTSIPHRILCVIQKKFSLFAGSQNWNVEKLAISLGLKHLNYDTGSIYDYLLNNSHCLVWGYYSLDSLSDSCKESAYSEWALIAILRSDNDFKVNYIDLDLGVINCSFTTFEAFESWLEVSEINQAAWYDSFDAFIINENMSIEESAVSKYNCAILYDISLLKDIKISKKTIKKYGFK